MTQTERIERICVKTAAWFARHRGGDPADLLQDARLAALQAARCYDPDAGTTIETWVNRYVWRRLQDAYEDKARRGEICQTLNFGRHAPYFEKRHPARRIFDLREFCTEISEDARLIVQILTEAPEFTRPGRGRQAEKPRLQQILAGLGWGRRRVARGFAEIEQAIA